MKITSMVVRLLAPEEFVFQWREDIAPVKLTMPVLELHTDEGVTGVATGWLPGPPREITDTLVTFLKPLVVGADPFDRERLWQEMMGYTRYMVAPKAASLVDFALWDLAGKAFGVPVYKLLGAYRDAIPAYATTVSYPEVQDYVDIALECKAAGYKAVKLHAYGVPHKDMEVCRAVREAVGDGYTLMLDPVSAYDWQGAMEVGRELERLGYHWYEDPIRDDDIAGFVQLTRSLDIPVLMGESNTRGIWPYATYLAQGAVDAVRVVGDAMGGITGMRKVGALCEAHNRRMEPHSYGSTLVQAAHLHYMLSVRNCEFFEMPVPKGPLDFAMKEIIEIDGDGMVHGPTAPGLGYEVDWDAVEDATIERVD